MFLPINIRCMCQAQGAPFFDQCTTVRKFTHDDGSGETHVIYRGWAICPFGFVGRWGAVAVTVKKRVHIYRSHEADIEVKNVAE
ncbi:MAG: hypothetical protein ACPGVA_16810 [Pikeienuella sp.]